MKTNPACGESNSQHSPVCSSAVDFLMLSAPSLGECTSLFHYTGYSVSKTEAFLETFISYQLFGNSHDELQDISVWCGH